MLYAKTVSDIPNAFRTEPLAISDLAAFYRDTMEVRTGNKGDSPLEDIYESCKIPSEQQNAFLLLGHRGCGKSTELNRLAKRLRDDGYPVAVIECQQETDIGNLAFSDVLILMGDALLQLAEEYDCHPDAKDLDVIRRFWSTTEVREDIRTDNAQLELEAGLGVGGDGLLGSLLQIFARVKSSLKYDVEKRSVFREEVVRRSSIWLEAMNRLADRLTEHLEGRQPVLIFEDLDKGATWEVFSGHGEQLTGVSFPVIYTFPIPLSYKPEFAEMETYFSIKRLPMIKVKTIDGEPNEEGRGVLLDIVRTRAELGLFEAGVLDMLIELTGGSLRHLFQAINKAAIIARRRGAEKVDADVARIALEEIKTGISARVQGDDHKFLAEICQGAHRMITDREKLLNMMQAQAVLEYNGQRWHDVHPLIAEYLKDLGMV